LRLIDSFNCRKGPRRFRNEEGRPARMRERPSG
jgi:hypothetical protein